MFTYNAPSKAFTFTSASGSGTALTFPVTVQGEGFTWFLNEANGTRSQYVITRTSDGKWKEVGQQSTDGGATWTVSIELLLARKP